MKNNNGVFVISNSWYYKIVNFLFIITGGRFFLDWILPTNPASHNPLFRNLWPNKPVFNSSNFMARAIMGVLCFVLHLIGFYFYLYSDKGKIDILNVMVNVYPMWVQIYFCVRVFNIRRLKIHIKRPLQI